MMKVSDYVIKFCQDQGVKDIFMLAGGGSMHLVNAVGKSGIRYVCNHHEQACAMAAEAYAKFKDDLGVALVTSGPAAINTLTGVAGAYMDSVPCLFISGQANRRQTVHNSKVRGLRQFGSQEIDIIPLVQPITKYAVMINEPERIRYHLEKAVHLAKSGRPGSVWLDIPLDVQGSLIDEAALTGFDPRELGREANIVPSDERIAEIAALLKHAKRPVIIAGHGIRLAHAIPQLHTLVEEFDIPVVTPFMGIDEIGRAHV
jgi:acetolactate synthase I/II/III large subunit